MQTIAVIDYGMGNLHSVTKALEHVVDENQKVILTSSPKVVAEADKVVFPGQGAARDCMLAIDEHGLRETVQQAAKNKPFLGICMGMQVLVHASEENGGTDCLALYPGEVRYFGDHLVDENGERLKVPHMGWNQVSQTRSHPLWHKIADNSRFYFVHSYYLETEAPDLEIGHCVYGEPFTCAIARDNVFAMQCHPEKSADAGLQLLTNFTRWDGEA
ncbi:MAG: imidazole glycerol phosphate synthase subunit HisH [Gammaproteobacteria bacterium]|jgi:glutamine amidotransferase|nr:imidazole glycerol phosphate synthase subunit HisH [Gammaproteobacteria bacterium]MBT3722262.1 imidazole glycerol phosphate synthase subunit HisH [Gammaproteobacteria bacterium]MBT4078874.1 imidazole glycerol phosphate synthase subunit HisH [Gammaproteobacteria bacterium]MBT4193642.1 imidazole glycerol phosphate synthase subunit HisH [Gammaproteobacteria bacterium]MBT4450612.1 imidazole glycerol phosphate synthase subunit HisH [Gammaproteobacteria bacterium]